MATVMDVAKKLLTLSASGEEPDPMTHLRLQKLLYYVQGWSLGVRGVPMFDERIEAWAHGPVVKDLFRTYSDHGGTPIPPPDEAVNLTVEEDAFVESVWEEYKGYSALALRHMTHSEKPWVEARRGYGPADRCCVEITKDALREFFSAAAA